MRVFLWVVLGFVIGVVAGYFGTILCYVVSSDLFKTHDQDGGGAMTVGFVVAPAVGLVCGFVAAVLCGLRAARRRKP
ncbi:hypothetical protein [Dokdonella sp.]|uniref:hypothetical protein n=1 Tax=Dokdonella sp. TaxID=2291710 RepID=UPI0026298996|nr:hypothetical protein [Dokdonella sp.]